MHDTSCVGEECDLFDFMAHHVGMTVLHPGGAWATEKLAEMCRVDSMSRVLDIACGKGMTAIHLARKYGCHVVGIDIDGSLIEQARSTAKQHGIRQLLEFRQGDALQLPFDEGTFDVALSQALLILLPDKEGAIREAVRVTRPGGRVGWLELSFRSPPPKAVLDEAATSACVICLRNAQTFEEWRDLFQRNGVSNVEVVEGEMGTRSRRMVQDEGLVNTARVMFKWLSDRRVRRRMRATFAFFGQNKAYIAYGIYVGERGSGAEEAIRAAQHL